MAAGAARHSLEAPSFSNGPITPTGRNPAAAVTPTSSGGNSADDPPDASGDGDRASIVLRQLKT